MGTNGGCRGSRDCAHESLWLRRLARSRANRLGVTPLAIVGLASGCYKWTPTDPAGALPERARVTYRDPSDGSERSLTLRDLQLVGDSLVGVTYQPERRFEDIAEEQRRVAIDSEAVLRVEARELDAGATLAAILLPIIVVVGVTASLGSSLSW